MIQYCPVILGGFHTFANLSLAETQLLINSNAVDNTRFLCAVNELTFAVAKRVIYETVNCIIEN